MSPHFMGKSARRWTEFGGSYLDLLRGVAGGTWVSRYPRRKVEVPTWTRPAQTHAAGLHPSPGIHNDAAAAFPSYRQLGVGRVNPAMRSATTLS